MKNLIIAAIALFTLNSFAQEKEVKKVSVQTSQEIDSQNQSPNYKADIETKKLSGHLDLSTEQYEKVHEIMLKHFASEQNPKKGVKEKTAIKVKSDKAELSRTVLNQNVELSQDLNEKLKEILSEEQYKKYQQYNLQKRKSYKKVMIKEN
ncbi:hypothetical protein [Winogradskyella flava]|uniref:LTXXQ motif family protein n=1 Tax=Winogradskyella flava TaxID=1884876 RepID=A0A842J0H9_9FLAO|nr:hypothetical protein [Winogradskyella flava]MBC2846478.1 hypothetical protein [Winogradskyella flava]